MASNNQADQQIPLSTNQQMNQTRSEERISESSQRIEEIDVAQADQSDSWETDDEGDFYNNGDLSDQENDDENFLDFGLSKHLIECYPTTTAEEVAVVGILCDICLNEYKPDDKLRTIPCLHRFHCKCIDKWLKKSSKCPMCRSDLRKSEWYSD